MAYATVEQLRNLLDQIPSDTDVPGTDAKIEAHALVPATGIINTAIAAGLALKSFTFAAYPATATTKLVTGIGGEYLTLPAHEIGSVTLVEYQSGSSPATYTTLDTDYWEEEEDGRLCLSWGWFGMLVFSRYRVTAKWGYGPAPDAIVQMCLELAVNIWMSKEKGGFAEFSGSEGGSYQSYVNGLTKAQQMTISNVVQTLWEPTV